MLFRWFGLVLSLIAGACVIRAGDAPLASAKTAAEQEQMVPMPELLPLKILTVLERTSESTVLVERLEKVRAASFIRSKSGELKPLVQDAEMAESDTILVGKKNQVNARFGDGSFVSLLPLSVVEITQRKQVGDNAIDTTLSLYQGAIRVRVPPMAAQGPFIIRLPNVKEGPINVAGPAHVYLVPPKADTKARMMDFDVAVFSGDAFVSLPLSKTATGDTDVTMDKGITVKVPASMYVRLGFRYEPMKEPTFGGPVYMLHLDMSRSDLDPKPHSIPTPEDDEAPPRIVPPANGINPLSTPPPPGPPVSGGG
jgi:hypothetical protein